MFHITQQQHMIGIFHQDTFYIHTIWVVGHRTSLARHTMQSFTTCGGSLLRFIEDEDEDDEAETSDGGVEEEEETAAADTAGIYSRAS